MRCRTERCRATDTPDLLVCTGPDCPPPTTVSGAQSSPGPDSENSPDVRIRHNLHPACFEAVDGLIALAIAVDLSAYFAADPGEYEEGMLRLISPRRQRTSCLFRDVANTMGWWMVGQLAPMAVLGVVSTVGLLIIGVTLAFTLGLFTGIMIFIPFVGATIAFIVTVLVAVSSDPSKIPLVAIIFIIVHVLEGYILTPLV